MKFEVKRIVPNKDFLIEGLSYIGAPRSNTAMFISKKVESLLSALTDVNECLVFAEAGIVVPEGIMNKHAFCFSGPLPFSGRNLPKNCCAGSLSVLQ